MKYSHVSGEENYIDFYSLDEREIFLMLDLKNYQKKSFYSPTVSYTIEQSVTGDATISA